MLEGATQEGTIVSDEARAGFCFLPWLGAQVYPTVWRQRKGRRSASGLRALRHTLRAISGGAAGDSIPSSRITNESQSAS